MNNEVVIEAIKPISNIFRLKFSIYLITKRFIDIAFSIIGLILYVLRRHLYDIRFIK